MRSRLAYLDAIKVLLVVGVIEVHAAITYGLDGSWYLESYEEMPGGVVAGVTILLGTATAGDFTPAATSPEPAGTNPASVAVGDFNGDGKPDLATANFGSGNVSILLRDGTGDFTAAATSPETAGTNPQSVAVGDFNGDGKPDLATANSGSGNVTILLGTALKVIGLPARLVRLVVPLRRDASVFGPATLAFPRPSRRSRAGRRPTTARR